MQHRLFELFLNGTELDGWEICEMVPLMCKIILGYAFINIISIFSKNNERIYDKQSFLIDQSSFLGPNNF